MSDLAQLSGSRRAAILVLRLGVERAGPLLKGLDKDEIAKIVSEVANLGVVDIDLANEVVDQFLLETEKEALPSGDVGFAREFLEAAFGDRIAREIMSKVDDTAPSVPFQFLDHLEPADIADNLAAEHPQTIALVLSHLTIDISAEIISNLPKELVPEVGARLATLDRVASSTICAVEEGLRNRFASALENRFHDATGGVDSLVEVLGLVDKDVEEMIFDGLGNLDAELVAEIRAKMFIFDDLMLLDDRQVQLVLRYVDSNRLPLALKGVKNELKDKILGNLSSRAQENLRDEMDLLGSVRLIDVEDAQSEVLASVRTLEESGELVINRGGNDFIS